MSIIHVEKLLAKELTEYVAYLQDPTKHHTVGIGNGPVRTKPVALYVYPFNVNIATGAIAKASASTAANTALYQKVSAHLFNQLTSSQFGLGIYKFSAARLVHKTGQAAKATPKNSRRTTREYGSKGGTSLSIPFGRSSATADELEVDVFEILKVAFETGGALPAGEAVTLTKEKFVEASG